jgi:hypothetical protein
MAKRLTDTDKWKDDWYISLSNDYRIIWQWLLDNCNHAGICKRSMGLLNMMCRTNIAEDDLISEMAGRVIIINNYWFIPNFIKFQYPTLKSNKPVIVSVVKELEKTGFFRMIPQSFGNDYLIINNDSPIVEQSLPDSKETIKSKSKSISISNNTVSNYKTVPKEKREKLDKKPTEDNGIPEQGGDPPDEDEVKETPEPKNHLAELDENDPKVESELIKNIKTLGNGKKEIWNSKLTQTQGQNLFIAGVAKREAAFKRSRGTGS